MRSCQYSGLTPLAPLYFFEAPGSDRLLWREGGGYGRVWHLTDALGSTTHLVNDAGAVVEQYLYDAYGTPSVYDWQGRALAGNASAVDNRSQWHGASAYEWLAGPKLYHARARFYLPAHGRWLQPDPLGQAGGLDVYAYCNDDPINGDDPSGLASATQEGDAPHNIDFGNGAGPKIPGGTILDGRNFQTTGDDALTQQLLAGGREDDPSPPVDPPSAGGGGGSSQEGGGSEPEPGFGPSGGTVSQHGEQTSGTPASSGGSTSNSGPNAIFLVGRNVKNTEFFTPKAESMSSAYRYSHPNTSVSIIQVRNFQDFSSALRNHTNITFVAYIGHGSSTGLFLSDAGAGIYPANVATLPNNNVAHDAQIQLISCQSANMAQLFANHFGVPTAGFTTGLSWGKFGLFTKFPRGSVQWRHPGQTEGENSTSTFPFGIDLIGRSAKSEASTAPWVCFLFMRSRCEWPRAGCANRWPLA